MPRAKLFTPYAPDGNPVIHPFKAQTSPWRKRGDRDTVKSIRFSPAELAELDACCELLADVRSRTVTPCTVIREAIAYYTGLCEVAGTPDPLKPSRKARNRSNPGVLIPAARLGSYTLRANGTGRGLNVWLSDCLAAVCAFLRENPDSLTWRAFVTVSTETATPLVGRRNKVRMTHEDLALYEEACRLSSADSSRAHASAVLIADSLNIAF